MWVVEREGLSEKIWEFEKEETREREKKRDGGRDIVSKKVSVVKREKTREREREQNKTRL